MRILITGSNKGFGNYLLNSFSSYSGYDIIGNGTGENINNQAIGYIQKPIKEITHKDLEEYNPDIIVNNAHGSGLDQLHFLITAATFLKSGIIININSASAITIDSFHPIYSAEKAALKKYSDTIKDSCLLRGLRIIDIYPGAIKCGRSKIYHKDKYDKLINPEGIAYFITTLIHTETFYVREIHLQRVPK